MSRRPCHGPLVQGLHIGVNLGEQGEARGRNPPGDQSMEDEGVVGTGRKADGECGRRHDLDRQAGEKDGQGLGRAFDGLA